MYTATSKYYTVTAMIAKLPTMVVRGSHDLGQVIEEPHEVKVSCPVLKTNRSGDRLVEFNPNLG
jgi:hypothetical protein